MANRLLALSIRAPLRILAVAALLAAAGWALGTRTEVVSDIRELVPEDLPALEGVVKSYSGECMAPFLS